MDTTKLRQLVKSKKFYIVDIDITTFEAQDYNFSDVEQNIWSNNSRQVIFRHRKILYAAKMLSSTKICYGIFNYTDKWLKTYKHVGVTNFIGDVHDFEKFLTFVKQGLYDSLTKNAKWVVENELQFYGA